MSGLNGVLAFMGGFGSGYMTQQQREKDRAQQEEQLQWMRDDRARAQKMRDDLGKAAAPEQVQQGATVTGLSPQPSAYSDPDVAASDMREARVAQDRTGVQTPTQAAPAIVFNGKAYPTMDEANKAATAYNAPQAQTARMADVLMRNGDPVGAMKLSESARAQQATFAQDQNTQALREVGTLLAKGGRDAIPEIYKRYDDGQTATVQPDPKGTGFTVTAIGPDGKPVGARHFRDEADFFANHVVPRFDPTKWLTREDAQAHLASEPPKTRNRIAGEKEVQEQWDANTKTWVPIGEGPRFAKQVAPAGGGQGTGIPNFDTSKTGEDFLKTLPASERALVKNIAEYKTDPRTLSTRGGHRENLLAKAGQYDPNYNQQEYGTRVAVRKDFTSGPTSKNVTAINTALGHIGTMSEVTDALGNKDIKAWNRLANMLGVELGKDEVTNFDLVRGAVGDELMRVFRQVGASETEAAEWRRRFDNANSPAQLKGAQRYAGDLLKSRIDALNDQWDRGMGTEGGYPGLLSEKSKKTMEKIAQKKATGGGVSGSPAMTNAKGWTLHKDASGNMAYVSPDGKQFEEVK